MQVQIDEVNANLFEAYLPWLDQHIFQEMADCIREHVHARAQRCGKRKGLECVSPSMTACQVHASRACLTEVGRQQGMQCV